MNLQVPSCWLSAATSPEPGLLALGLQPLLCHSVSVGGFAISGLPVEDWNVFGLGFWGFRV